MTYFKCRFAYHLPVLAAVLLTFACEKEGDPLGPVPEKTTKDLRDSAVATTASAAQTSAAILCTPGSVQACAEVLLQVLPTPVGTRFNFKMRNLQGSFPLDNTGGSTVFSIQLTIAKPNWSWFPEECQVRPPSRGCSSSIQVVGTVTRFGNPTAFPTDMTFYDFYQPTYSIATLILWAQSPASIGFFGCNVGPFPPDENGQPVADAFGTCPSAGQNGYLWWTFETTARFKLSDMGFQLNFRDISNTSRGCSYRTPTGNTCEVR